MRTSKKKVSERGELNWYFFVIALDLPDATMYAGKDLFLFVPDVIMYNNCLVSCNFIDIIVCLV